MDDVDSIELAYRSLDAGDLNTAAARLDEVAPESRDGRFYEALSALESRRQRYGLAAEHAQRAISMGRDTARSRLLRQTSRAYLGMSPHEKLKGEPADAQDAYYRGYRAYDEGQFREAIRLAERTASMSPGFGGAECLRLASEAALGDAESLVRLRNRWREENDLSAIAYLIEDVIRRKAYAEAERYVPEVLGLTRFNSNLVSRLGMFLVRAGRPREALDLLEKSGSADHGQSRLNTVRGAAYQSLGDMKQAIRCFERAFEAEPAGLRESKDLFRAQLKLKDRKGAARTFWKFLRASKKIV